jgi:type III secretion protein U
MRNLVEFLKSCLKVAIISLVLWKVLKESLPMLVLIPAQDLDGAVGCLHVVVYEMVKYCAGTFVVIAACDYFWQRHLFLKQHKMSKDEVKNEYKEMEGDPHIKAQRKHLHQEMAMNDAAAQVRKSSVLVTNPTHIAVALRYQKGETPLPIVTARGEGALAQRMMEIAKEEGIPIMRNVPLAHDLWEKGALSQYIPSELIEPVAEVLRWVQEVTGKA